MTRPAIIFVATAWGAKHGGLNAFNTGLAIAVAKRHPQLNSMCIVLDASPEEIRIAKQYGVNLVGLNRPTESEFDIGMARTLVSEHDFGETEWWIGHDVLTTPFALALQTEAKRGEAAAFMHASFAEYSHLEADPTKGDPRAYSQRVHFPKANRVFGVGPLLRDRLIDMVGSEVVQLAPGLLELYHQRTTSHLDAIIFGRLKWEDHDTKQLSLAVRAFARSARYSASGFLALPKLTVVGLKGDTPTLRSTIHSAVQRWAGRQVQIEIHGFISNQEELRRILHGKNLCIFPSWHDGFGLSAWEAIGAGIPVLLSRNTGAYRLLHQMGRQIRDRVRSLEVRGGTTAVEDTSDLNEQPDVVAWSDAISAIAGAMHDHLDAADELRDLLLEQYTWDHAADAFCDALGLSRRVNVEGNVRPLSMAITRRRLSPIEEQLIISAAKTEYRKSHYLSARAVLGECGGPWSMTNRYEALLLESKLALRLNEHNAALELSRLAAARFQHVGDHCRHVSARGVENTVLRAFGDYGDAIAISQAMVQEATKYCPDALLGAWRDHARSLALGGNSQAAETFANKAYEEAGEDYLPRAKARLALGEAFRHGGKLRKSVDVYLEAISLAERAGHPDCLLWSHIALADSWFLLSEAHNADVHLLKASTILSEQGRKYPLETLHAAFSRAVLEQRVDLLGNLIEQYLQLGVRWPEQYCQKLESQEAPGPKPF